MENEGKLATLKKCEDRQKEEVDLRMRQAEEHWRMEEKERKAKSEEEADHVKYTKRYSLK